MKMNIKVTIKACFVLCSICSNIWSPSEPEAHCQVEVVDAPMAIANAPRRMCGWKRGFAGVCVLGGVYSILDIYFDNSNAPRRPVLPATCENPHLPDELIINAHWPILPPACGKPSPSEELIRFAPDCDEMQCVEKEFWPAGCQVDSICNMPVEKMITQGGYDGLVVPLAVDAAAPSNFDKAATAEVLCVLPPGCEFNRGDVIQYRATWVGYDPGDFLWGKRGLNLSEYAVIYLMSPVIDNPGSDWIQCCEDPTGLWHYETPPSPDSCIKKKEDCTFPSEWISISAKAK